MAIKLIIILILLIVIFYFWGKGQNEVGEETAPAPETVAEDAIPEPEVNEEKQLLLEVPKQEETPPAIETPDEESDDVPKSYVVAVIEQNKVSDLWNYGKEIDWKRALDRYYDLLGDEEKALNESMEKITVDEIKSLSVEEFFIFLHDEYFVWKYADKRRLSAIRRSLVRYVSEDKMSELSDIHKRIFELDREDILFSVKTASEIKGLTVSSATGLLSLLFPESFSTVDKYILNAFAEIDGLASKEEVMAINPDSIKNKDAVLVTEIIREKAKELNHKFNTDIWTPRKIDMILWAIEK